MTTLPVERLGEQTPDLVMLPRGQQPWMFPPAARQPIWWNKQVAIYAPNGALAPIMPPLDAAPEPPPIEVKVSDVREADGKLAFTLTVDDHSPDRWTGQDWVVIRVDDSPWAIPRRLEGDTPVVEQWYGSQMIPGRGRDHARVRLRCPSAQLGGAGW